MAKFEIELQKKIIENLQTRLELKLEAYSKNQKQYPAAAKDIVKAEDDYLKLAEKLLREMRKYLKLTNDKKSFEIWMQELSKKIK